MAKARFTDADLAYIHADYLPLDELCFKRPLRQAEVRRLIGRRLLPQPSYVLPDGTGMFREFAPNYDRREDPPSRDRLIEAARLRFPDVFTSAVSP